MTRVRIQPPSSPSLTSLSRGDIIIAGRQFVNLPVARKRKRALGKFLPRVCRTDRKNSFYNKFIKLQIKQSYHAGQDTFTDRNAEVRPPER